MIPAGFTLILVYLFPFSPDITLIVGLWFIVYGTIRAYMRHGLEVSRG